MRTIAPGLLQFDTCLGGWEGLTAGFLVEGDRPALIEPGAQTSAKTVAAELAAHGVGPNDLAWIVVTHIHLDHAGAVGDIARLFPLATVVVHREGARHLVDPERLIASAGRVYGDLLDSLYGRMEPVPAERVLAADDGLRVDVGGGRSLRMVDSPGHARHHLAIFDEESGTLLAGDAVGVQLSTMGTLRPAAPPPEFDLEQSVNSLHIFASLLPTQLLLTHFGAVADPQATLVEAEESLRRWVEVASQVTDGGGNPDVDAVEKALSGTFAQLPHGISLEERRRLELLNGLRSNAAGITRYLVRKHGNPA